MQKEIRYFNHHEDNLLEVISLGDKNTKSLGYLPHDAYKEYLSKNGIVVCKIDNILAGYCLFRKNRRNHQIRIAQLCTNEIFRGKGIADAILNFIKTEFNKSFRGIALNCRRDYEHASRVWKRNNFFPLNEKRSKSKKENYLLQWYFDFNHINLFNSVSNSKIKALFDLNIVIKLRESKKEEIIHDEEIKYLFNDDLLTEVDYFYAYESYSEIVKDEDNKRRIQTRSLLGNFKKLVFNEREFLIIYNKIKELCPPKSDNDKSDRRQLAEAISNNVSFFITTDKNLISECKIIEENYNINIVLPSEFIVQFDQIQNSSSFLPRNIGGAAFEIRKLPRYLLEQVVEQFVNPNQEKKSDFSKNLHIYCSKPYTEVKIIFHKEDIISILGYEITRKQCEVNFLRIKNISNKYILFNQTVNEIINTSIKNNVNLIKISSVDIDSHMEELLIDFGFFIKESYFVKILMNGVFNSTELIQNDTIQEIINKDFNITSLSNEQKYILERTIYPGKVKDLQIQNIIIPIKPNWASQLFDFHLSSYSLFGANEKLQWNRKNIYFRSINPNIEKYPARILWYVSSDNYAMYRNRTKGIVACSYLEEVHIDTPKPLFSQFNKIGIYKWENIYNLSKRSIDTLIKAIEFSDTEVFKDIIPLFKIQQVLDKQNTFQSPLKITEEQFFKIYSHKR